MADANKVRFISTSNCLPDSLSCAEVGVKQSGDRLFQVNNLKRKFVDELFLDQSSSFSLPLLQLFINQACAYQGTADGIDTKGSCWGWVELFQISRQDGRGGSADIATHKDDCHDCIEQGLRRSVCYLTKDNG